LISTGSRVMMEAVTKRMASTLTPAKFLTARVMEKSSTPNPAAVVMFAVSTALPT